MNSSPPSEQATAARRKARLCWAGLPLIAVVLAAILSAMGRVAWCPAGDWALWAWEINTQHNSQHLVDPYTLSHIQHGIALLLILTAVFGRSTTLATRTLIIGAIEAGWEVVENTPLVIDRYRTGTVALNYYGDSIANSLSDYMACLLGAWIASRLPKWAGWLLFVALEITSILWIHDSLLLNILMLVWPIEAIRQWQSAA